MTSTLRLSWLVPFFLAQQVAAQTPAVSPVVREPVPAGPRVEKITHEDGLSRIDEVRVGGQTRSIQVSPKTGAPAYQVAPLPQGNSPAAGAGSEGKSSWRVLNF
jgi:hypothetical protein